MWHSVMQSHHWTVYTIVNGNHVLVPIVALMLAIKCWFMSEPIQKKSRIRVTSVQRGKTRVFPEVNQLDIILWWTFSLIPVFRERKTWKFTSDHIVERSLTLVLLVSTFLCSVSLGYSTNFSISFSKQRAATKPIQIHRIASNIHAPIQQKNHISVKFPAATNVTQTRHHCGSMWKPSNIWYTMSILFRIISNHRPAMKWNQ